MNDRIARIALATAMVATVAVSTSCGGGDEDGPGIVTPPAPITRTVAVLGGTGNGRVTSSPGSIDCRVTNGVASGTCTATVSDKANVTITATADADQLFKAWGNDCSTSTTSSCQLSATKDLTISAGFVKKVETVSLEYQTPSSDDGAAMLTITGPAIVSIAATSGQQIAQRTRTSDGKTVLLVRGNLTSGVAGIVSISGLDVGKAFSATVDQVAARQSGGYKQRTSLTGYTATIK